MAGRVRVFIACSLDGFIAGPNDDLSWLPDTGDDDHGFAAFFGQVGAMLMGRRTHDVAASFDGPWPYAECPVLVATTHPLVPKQSSIVPVFGAIEGLVAQALAVADGRDVYIDGGTIIRQALDADLIDELTITYIPVVLGEGTPLFFGVQRRRFEIATLRPSNGLVQMVMEPVR